MLLVSIAVSAVVVAITACMSLLFFDRRLEQTTWDLLAARSKRSDIAYSSELVAHLPEPARRYFDFSIAQGTPLSGAVTLRMEGQLGLGSKLDPNYRNMRASQILAPPYGLVWRVDMGALSGSDGCSPENSWTRFRLFGLIPVVRAGGNPDHHRSAFGRVVAEGTFWVPAFLLLHDGVVWESLDENSVRATIVFGAFTQSVDIEVGETGQPQQVVIQRWSNENVEKVFREQPFGGYLSDFKDFSGYQLPTTVEGGNHFGSDSYFPFYKASVTEVHVT